VKASKNFFFEKSSKKLLALRAMGVPPARPSGTKSFLRRFFSKKRPLSSPLCSEGRFT
jgi:hypothetical protein